MTPPSLQSRVNLSEVLSHTGSVVEQAGADHTIADTPLTKHSDVVGFDAPVNLNLHRPTTVGNLFIDGLREASNLCFNIWNEGLTSKSRIHAHDQYKVHLAQNFERCFYRRSWVQHNANGCTAIADGSEKSMKVFYGFNMNGDVVAPCIDVILIAFFGVFNHEMSIEHGVRAERRSEATNHRWSEREVGDKVSIHDVEMQPVQPCVKRFLAVRSEVCKIGREDTWCDDHAIPVPPQTTPFEEDCHTDIAPSNSVQTHIMRHLERQNGEHMGEVRDISDSEFNDTINGSEWVIVDFWAPWCAPCKAIGPVLAAVAEEREVVVAKVDTDQHQATAGQLGVRSIPALFMYHNGTMVSSKTGGMPKPKLLAWIDEVMNADDF